MITMEMREEEDLMDRLCIVETLDRNWDEGDQMGDCQTHEESILRHRYLETFASRQLVHEDCVWTGLVVYGDQSKVAPMSILYSEFGEQFLAPMSDSSAPEQGAR
jgi:hypothetical protein